jgi:hypothetical protein
MPHNIIKLLKNLDGEEVKDGLWHLSKIESGSTMTACTGEIYNDGDTTEYIEKRVTSGGITCKECIKIINFYKSIKL